MRRKLNYVFLLIIVLMSNTALAQKTIKGIVKDTNGNPISGVSVMIKGSNKGTVTNNNGEFQIVAKDEDILEFSGVSFSKKSMKASEVNGSTIGLESSTNSEESVVVVGSRKAGRIKMETTVPVDVISVNQVQLPTARMDITSILNYVTPSFNYNKQSGSDGADHVDLATLRGLGPDQTLVLINGKRRHQTAFVSVFGTRGRGNSGTDLNAIPISMIDRVEVLRDGASAQYGSDAIAGVINIILKKSTGQLTGNYGYSGYYDNKYNTAFGSASLRTQYIHDRKIDGNAFTASLNYGEKLGKKGGFINIGFDALTQGKTFRQVLKTENYLTDDDAMYVNPYRRANGDASLNMAGVMYNLEAPTQKEGVSFYSYGSYNRKHSDAYAFTRNFSARPERFPTTPDGSPAGWGSILKRTDDGEIFYNPHIQTKITDVSNAIGLKGVNKNNWSWDVSNVIGSNNFHFFGDQTFNASLGNSQTHFDDGGFRFTQNTINANFSKEMEDKLHFAWGAELRNEWYQLFASEEASYKNYSDGSKATGAQGFPGYQPNDEVKAKRSVIGGYVELEKDFNSKFTSNAALRVERYSDFGFTSNVKLAARYKVAQGFNLRGSVSTGFRAPSLQQINFSSTFTTVQAGNISEVKIAPNGSPIANAAGIPNLKQEKSLNGSLGFAYKANPFLNITVDAYYVKIKDRVVLSGQFDGSDPNLDAALTSQMAALNVGLAQFFANAANTTNAGVDIVADYNRSFGNNRIKVLLAANIQKMNIDKINIPTKLSGSEFLQKTFFSDREQKFLLASAPNAKATLNLEYGFGKNTIGTRVTYFGKVSLYGYGQDGLGINPTVPLDNGSGDVPDLYNYGGKVVPDLYFTRPITTKWKLFLGVDNFMNVHPDLGVVRGAKDWAYNTETGGAWDAVQMGYNGRRVYVRLGFNF